jgi:hypothetical protein
MARLHSFASLALSSVVISFAACGDDTSSTGTDLSEVTFEKEVELFPGFEFDTGLQPPASPVQASFAVIAKGNAIVTAVAAASGSESSPTLSGLPDRGTLKLGGGFSMTGNLIVDLTGLSYDGEIPGLDDVDIPFEGEASFDPFLLDDDAEGKADIEPAELPGIPLPAPIPGELVLTIVEGSFVSVTLSGRSVCVDGSEGHYDATIARGGTLVIQPLIRIEVLGVSEDFPIPEFSVDFALGGPEDIAMKADVESFGAKPGDGDHTSEKCESGGDGGGSGSGGSDASASTGDATTTTSTGDATTSASTGFGPSGSTGTGGTQCASDDDCIPYPCVEGICSEGGGICESGLTYQDEELDACVSASCCDAFEACTYDYTDIDGCNDCTSAGGGPRCDAYLACADAACGGYPICDSGLASATPEDAECLGTNCCDQFNACTANGTDVDACYDCLNEGGGALCNDVYTCIDTFCPL